MLRSLKNLFPRTHSSFSFSRSFSRSLSTSATAPASASFTFDIDGVLLHANKPLPCASRALSILHDGKRWSHPVIFLTNGGGMLESTRAQQLSALLNAPITPAQVILSHTPLRAYVSKHNALLAIGRGCARVAQQYGFSHAIDPADITCKTSTPFVSNAPETRVHDTSVARRAIDAIAIMGDSTDWARDIQLISDALEIAEEERRSLSFYACNADLTFPTGWKSPRIAGGAFRTALEAVLNSVRKHSPHALRLDWLKMGKPEMITYEYAENALRLQNGMAGEPVFAIGDNPAADVRGATRRGRPWTSILVKTGNFKGDNDEQDPADIVVDDVEHAVLHALRISS